LAKLHEGPGTSAALGRDGSPAACADRVAKSGVRGQDPLYPYVVTPPVDEVVFVAEALSFPQTEIAEGDLVGVVAEGDAASVGPTKLNTVDHEAVEVVVPPAEDKLQGGVQIGDRAVASD
jgi:hypothetical protein